MEWDGGTVWRVALGIFFVLCGAGAGYALLRLGNVLGRVSAILGDVKSRVVPILSRVETTLDEVNSELDKVDQITGSVVGIVKAAEQTTTALQSALSAPVRGVASLINSLRGGLKSRTGAKGKG